MNRDISARIISFYENIMFKRSAQGFTLIELLVVIAIIGILSSVVLASLNSARKKGRDARRVADVKQLQLALELYYDANQTYPLAVSSANLVTNGYISTIPGDPSSTVTCSAGTEASCYGYSALQTDAATACTAVPCPSYVIRAVLETSGHSALNGDVDTNPVGGIDCSDGLNYCAKP